MAETSEVFEVLVDDPDKDWLCNMCMEYESEITYESCGHKLLCFGCYSVNINKIDKCVKCDTKIGRVTGDLDACIMLFREEMLNDNIYEFISSYLDMVTVTSCAKTVMKEITDQYNEICKMEGQHIRITVDQTELLLKKCISKGFFDEPHGKLRNLLVALCIEPWKVDVKLGSYGVCYHGNFGDTPSIRGCIELYYYNNEKLQKNSFH